MHKKIIRLLWGDLHGDELRKFFLLGLGMFFIIGSYWPVRTLKESIFLNMVGPLYHPYVKGLSLIMFFPLVLLYSKLVNMLSREKVVYVFSISFACIGLLFAYCLADPVMGVANLTMSPRRLVAWFFFIFAEMYISLMTALYWSFINDITTPESANKGYGVIIFGSQAGGLTSIIFGNYLASKAENYNAAIPSIVVISMVLLFLVAVVVFVITKVVAKDHMEGYCIQEQKKEEVVFPVSFFAGLRLLVSHPYVAGIFSLVFFHELIAAIMQYQMYFLVKTTYSDPALVTQFLMRFGVAVQFIACMFALFGTSYVQRIFGVRFCLISYPLCLAGFIALYVMFPSLMFIAAVMLVAKALSYALSNPAKEILYIPTTKDIKYESKAWIDIFGARFAKGAGALVNGAAGPLVAVAGGVALIGIFMWVFIANALSKKFYVVTKNKQQIQ